MNKHALCFMLARNDGNSEIPAPLSLS
eukprot:COSAG03_NODE_18673_length_350_cov_1.203187_1_plen_26_part_10